MVNQNDKLMSLFQEGKFQQLYLKIQTDTKNFKKIPPESKNKIIGLLCDIQASDKALLICSEELPAHEMMKASLTMLREQVLLARINLSFNCLITAQRISNNLLKAIIAMNHIDAATREEFISELSFIFFKTQNIEAVLAIEYSKLSDTLEAKKNLYHRLSLININKRPGNSILLDSLDDKKINHHFFLRDFLLLQIQRNALTPKHIYELVEISKFDTILTLQSFHHYLLGVAKHLEGNDSEAILHLKTSLATLSKEDYIQYLKVLFALDSIQPNEVAFPDNVFLRCFAGVCVESYLTGNRYLLSDNINLSDLSPKKALISQLNEDCWNICHKEIQSANYNNISFSTSKNVLDLKSGIIICDGKIEILSKNRCAFLIALISCGKLGAHELHMIERLYTNEYAFLESAKLRVRNLSFLLKKIGIKIKRHKNYYTYDFNENAYQIIFPKDHITHGPMVYLAKSYSKVNIELISSVLNVKRSTASSFLKEWKENDLINRDGAMRYGEYFFTRKAA